MPAMALLAKAVAMAAGLEVEEAPLVEGEPLELPPVGEGEELPVLVTPVWVCLVTVELEEGEYLLTSATGRGGKRELTCRSRWTRTTQ